ncbi:MAG TPA: T9SS type A sorting domain-containing protein [Flavobacteriales bacterium]|nr:T9SS type A sorting domain-containing protein [Flavobacteriales bacterium]
MTGAFTSNNGTSPPFGFNGFLPTVSGTGSSEIFVAKFDKNGASQEWIAASKGSAGTFVGNTIFTQKITVEGGVSYVSGSFTRSGGSAALSLDNGLNTITTLTGNNDGFIGRVDGGVFFKNGESDVMIKDEPIISKSTGINPTIYPNPTTGILTIEGAEGTTQVYDIYGRLVLTANTNTLDISQAADGIYFVRVVDEQGKVYSCKIVKE